MGLFCRNFKGHSPAGGCLMAMSCDYRIMAKGPYKIGLNETLLVRIGNNCSYRV